MSLIFKPKTLWDDLIDLLDNYDIKEEEIGFVSDSHCLIPMDVFKRLAQDFDVEEFAQDYQYPVVAHDLTVWAKDNTWQVVRKIDIRAEPMEWWEFNSLVNRPVKWYADHEINTLYMDELQASHQCSGDLASLNYL